MATEYHREEVIVSHPHPFHGQHHRSSGNFSTRYLQDENGNNAKYLKWTVEGRIRGESDNISFMIYEDVPAGIDRKKLNGRRLKNGSVTEAMDERKIYIHSPQSASDAFTVTVTGLSSIPLGSELIEADASEEDPAEA